MTIRMSIARCCCNVNLYNPACRAWNTEGTYTYDKTPTTSGLMASGNTRFDTSTSEPYANHQSAAFTNNYVGNCLSAMAINPVGGSGGFTIVATGLSSEKTALVTSNFSYGRVATNSASLYAGVSANVESRYGNKLSLSESASGMTVETTVNVSAIPPYLIGTAGTAWREYSILGFGQSPVCKFGVDDAGYITYARSSNVNSFPLSRLTVSGVDVAVTAPFTVTIKKPSADNGTTDLFDRPLYDFTIEVDGVEVDQTFEETISCVLEDTGWTASVYPPHQVSFGTQSPTTTSDMTMTIASIEYLIGSGETVLTTPTFTTASPWSELSGTITCDNSLVTTGGTTDFGFVGMYYGNSASADVTLTNSTLHRIAFTCLAIDPAPVSPENGTDEQPVIEVDGVVISATRNSGLGDQNREVEEYFFTSASSGDTNIKFYGYEATEYTISSIVIAEIPA